MGEGEKIQGGFTPEEEEYRAAEGITRETDKDREARVEETLEETEARLEQKIRQEIPDQPQPIGIKAELDRLNRLAAQKLGEEEPENVPPQEADTPDAEAASDIESMMPTEGRGGMHQRVETATRAEAQQAANLERARRESMQQEVTEGMQRYRTAFTEAVNLLLLRPRSDTVKERWDALNAKNARELLGVDAVVKSGQFLDPMVIRAKFDVAAERLTRFAQDADRS
jgi:hypothetical protein